MTRAGKRKTSLSHDEPEDVVANARRRWLKENTEAFTAQDEWLAKNGHPLADIMAGPEADTWRR
jgi:antitoxin CcdA